ncbi:DUF707 domain-containing protein [Sediminibacterium roseum]|uniref:DUF707 domain-containing protein n=1 Tax=Sediminibacterium roseum TaxID=1978412 RepID=A0ABW9ZQC5_9BACT|nr:DUF707 domain-containing protein [Sediminibacterium roseum]NCI49119.1 DUF707 domain-containing protein [Sediminibacterium roseum]
MRYLVISAVGDESLHPEWIAGNAGFDLCLLYYGNSDEVAERYAATTALFFMMKGSKYHLLKSFIETNLSFIEGYDYIWLPDNDVSISTADINKLFRIADENKLLLSQPAMTGYISHKVTTPTKNFLRFTNFVEVLAPLMSRETLLRLKDTFNLNYSGWGYDYLWPYLLGYPRNKIAIIDSVIMKHTKPVGKDYSRFPKHPEKEMKELIKAYAPGLRAKIIVYDAIAFK